MQALLRRQLNVHGSAIEAHGGHMEVPWMRHGFAIEASWKRHEGAMEVPWRCHGCGMGAAWRRYRKRP